MDKYCLVFLLIALPFGQHGVQLSTADDEDSHFLNEWAVGIDGGLEVAREVASQHGYTLLRPLKSIPDHYILERNDVPHRSRRSASHHTKRLVEDVRVVFVEQQQQKTRVKRDLVDRELVRDIVTNGGQLNDPRYSDEWYLLPDVSEYGRRDGASDNLRVRDAWKRGYTGKGITVCILDDGVEAGHPDLKDNFDPKASHDFNDNDDDPTPRYDPTNENKHGTRCAGEIAMVANNNNCGVGIAFDSKIGGVRMLDGRVTDRLEGDALSFNSEYIDVYSASWGPNDDGKTVEGPGILARKGLEIGIKQGRKGKGSLYAWASGNGGRINDNCNADGYTSSIYTISVSSASQFGKSPWYGEKCSSTLTAAYSSGSATEKKVVSSDLHGKCTDGHTGTSAAAPMAAGVLALLLQANNNITWRDAQHLVMHTSRMEPLASETGWQQNGAGYCFNERFGFGLINALGLVEAAEKWENVGEQHICTVEPTSTSNFPQEITPGQFVEVEFSTDGCQGQDNEVNWLEHIQVVFDVDHENRGRIYADLESPMGTKTTLFYERSYDTSKKGFKQWPLMSVHTWGERPQGKWRFRVADRNVNGTARGRLNSAKLVLYGTKDKPKHQTNIKGCGKTETQVNVPNPSQLKLKIAELKSLLHNNNNVKNPNVQSEMLQLVSDLEGQYHPPASS
ncbi:neuroendocrine convertase 1-like isoform X2 [Physella acuta]|uniref:neuroendocrine convertase 1-like isoform X2 n=1 Tax=Physella acuta TaxID=109671 RepID=UPI0027DDC09D|nr:neuroendocrine convertase 1-like isoform X2 [Physella acuta]